MALIATSKLTFSEVVKHELWPDSGYCRKEVIYNGAAGDLEIGQVLGVVTSTGKYAKYDSTKTDGTQNAAAVVIEYAKAEAATDTKVLVINRGPVEVNKLGLVGVEAANLAAVTTALEAKGFAVN